MLDSHEAARRLGVKLTTLYAYVSRGLLTSHRSADGRRSLFRLDELEQLSHRARGGRVVEAKLATVTTAVTQIRDDGPYYRGRSACELARTGSFEEAAAWLWDVPGEEHAPWPAAQLPRCPTMRTSDALRWAVVLSGARDRLRSDLRPPAVVRAARRLIATVVGARPGAGTSPPHDASAPGGAMAARLARRFRADAGPALIEAVDAALVLLADHELATSTVAVRVAASTRADLYDAMLAGFGTLGGPLHGGASELAYALLDQARREGLEAAVGTALRWHHTLPGFGHTVYQVRDPRFETLLGFVDEVASKEERQLVQDLVELAASHEVAVPNIDLALAALTVAGGLPPDAGQTIFSVARMAGWTAHYLEELAERPLRFRARAVYVSRT